MAAYYNAQSNHCFNKLNPTIRNLQNEQRNHVQLETLNKLPSVFAMIGSADHFLSLCSALQLLTDLICSAELCLTLIYLIAHNECQTFLLSYFSPSFLISKSHPSHLLFLSILESVRGGRWAFDSRNKRLLHLIFQHNNGYVRWFI